MPSWAIGLHEDPPRLPLNRYRLHISIFFQDSLKPYFTSSSSDPHISLRHIYHTLQQNVRIHKKLLCLYFMC
ncbi:hypothetical protein EYC80_006004 [Monilinia laxa]|uniref:Uncharacterized protein n=1 Tax=Monilinia laxa TaxID=61186 RepID=A0A5N6KFT8_MONLA|nr:hypothetical protein EYC80_006004 [Monilinia laxa]